MRDDYEVPVDTWDLVSDETSDTPEQRPHGFAAWWTRARSTLLVNPPPTLVFENVYCEPCPLADIKFI
jgi:hypothetical protein